MAATFVQFAELCDLLAATTRKLEKRALMAACLKQLSTADAALAALYFAGQPFAETDRRALNIGGALLTKVLAQLSGAGSEVMSAAYRRHGDLGAAAFDLLAGHARNSSQALTLGDVEASFSALAAARGPAAKQPVLQDLLGRAAPVEAKYLIKLVLGDMRIGVKQSLVEEAIAAAFSAETAQVRRALMLNGSLPEVIAMAAAGTLAEARMRLFHPLGFMLASPVESVEEALKRFAEEVDAEHSSEDPESIALRSDNVAARHNSIASRYNLAVFGAHIEDKYDGMRAQLHCGDPTQPGRVELFSRNREDIAASFPEITDAFANIKRPAILDGELLAWDARQMRASPFAALQQRLGRKRVNREMLEQTPVVFMAFDLLSLDGELLVDTPLAARRRALEAFAAAASAVTAGAAQAGQQALFPAKDGTGFPRLVLAPARQLENAEQLDQAYIDARSRGNEGVMLKSLAGLYQPGRRGLAWLKLKRELATLDVVVTGAEWGNGRRASVLSDYTFAVRDGGELKNVGKAYSGLTDAEISELTRFLQEHTLEDFGHFRTVEPLLVLEVAFNNVMRSTRHASGFALRFPRIMRIRTDKPVAEIDTLARVEEIYASQPDKPAEILE